MAHADGPSLLGSAQIAKTQVGLNLVGQILCETPARAMVVLPSLNAHPGPI